LFTFVRSARWIAKDLDDLFPHKQNFFIVDPSGHRGINCRFGMHGIIAEAHYDGSRNMIAMLKGCVCIFVAVPLSLPLSLVCPWPVPVPVPVLVMYPSVADTCVYRAKRYVLLPPRECHNVYFYKQRHPSSRHSKLDWSKPVDPEKYPKWAKAQAIEVRPAHCTYSPHAVKS
jgi:hypothetical protein